MVDVTFFLVKFSRVLLIVWINNVRVFCSTIYVEFLICSYYELDIHSLVQLVIWVMFIWDFSTPQHRKQYTINYVRFHSFQLVLSYGAYSCSINHATEPPFSVIRVLKYKWLIETIRYSTTFEAIHIWVERSCSSLIFTLIVFPSPFKKMNSLKKPQQKNSFGDHSKSQNSECHSYEKLSSRSGERCPSRSKRQRTHRYQSQCETLWETDESGSHSSNQGPMWIDPWFSIHLSLEL